MEFDFSAYLAAIDPGHRYKITKLTGGFVNLTVRATRDGSETTSSSKVSESSLVLKYAPPYVAGRGEGFPMTRFRQVIEAHALSAVKTAIPLGHDIQIPSLLRHDPESHVIIISDLGDIPNLSEMFSELGGYTEFGGQPHSRPPPTMPSPESSAYFSSIGSKLGRFFALLHSPKTLKLIESDLVLNPNRPSEVDLRNAWLEISIKPVGSQLGAFPEFLSPLEVDRLYKVLEGDFNRPLSESEKSFVLGDCWTSAILVEPQVTKPDPKVGVIDWDFLLSDGVFMAILHNFLPISKSTG